MAQTTMYSAIPNSPRTELSAAITEADGSMDVVNAALLPAAPNLATLGTDEMPETILYTGKSGNSLTGVTRGFNGTTARAWNPGTKVARYFTAYDHDAFRGNIADHEARLAPVDAATSAATAGTLVKRDANGRARAATPSDATDIANKGYVDASVQSALSVKANLDSPVFTGSPKVPTAGTSTNDTTAASAAFVRAAITQFATGVPSGTGANSTLLGTNNIASGAASLAEGADNQAIGEASHVEGSRNISTGPYSHTEGWFNFNKGTATHAEGRLNSVEINGGYSHIEGTGNYINDHSSHAEGAANIVANGEIGEPLRIGNAYNECYLTIVGEDTYKVQGYTIGQDVVVTYLSEFDPIATCIRTTIVSFPEDNTVIIADGLPNANADGGYGIIIPYNESYDYLNGRGQHVEGVGCGAFGKGAHAEGLTTIALGLANHSEGILTTSRGEASHAEGSYTLASAWGSHAEGSGGKALGTASHAEGSYTQAYGNFSHAEGNFSEALGHRSHSEGDSTRASGSNSHTEGDNSVASGISSHAQNGSTRATGNYSHAGGLGTEARYAQTAIGIFNIGSTTITDTAYNASGEALIIGNGTIYAKSNAFKVLFNGTTYADGAYNSTGADYAEYFEWLDGNTEEEDRVGFFVALDGENIRKATSEDDDILGIVSATPAIIGDAYEAWKEKYVTDEWGRIQYQEILIPAVKNTITNIDSEGNETEEEIEVSPEHYDIVPVLNPDWNPEQEYVSREHRPEWAPVGMIGKLLVRDDGTAQVNGRVSSNDEGAATASAKGYRVLKRVSENIIQVLIK